MEASKELLQDCCGNPLTCESQEALELYNDILESFISQKKSFIGTLNHVIELDNTFVLAHCLMGFMLCDIYNSDIDPIKVQVHLDAVTKLYSKVLEREQRHIDAFFALSQGNTPKSNEILTDITVKYPRDLQALPLAFVGYKSTAQFPQMRDLLSRAVTHCPKESHFYPYLVSLYSFSLEESNERQLAEELCQQSLALQPVNPWAIHTMSHVIEETKEAEKGVEFLLSTRTNWRSSLYCHHLTWHLTLFYIDLNQIDKVLEEFDNVMSPCMKSFQLFQLVDICSLFWRLNIMGIDPGEERWKLVTEAFQNRVGHPKHSWLETHLMMSLCHGKVSADTARLALARQVIKSMEDFAQSGTSYNCTIANIIGIPVCNALLAYGEEKYDEVLSLMLPLKYDFVKFGGSWAQRQIFDMTLIMAAINGNQLQRAQALIIELKAQKPHNKVLQQLFDQVCGALKRDEKLDQ